MGLHALALAAESGPGAIDHAGHTPFEEFAEGVLFVSVDVGLAVLFLGLLLMLYRVLRGPTLVDRGVATDLITFLSAGLVILVTIRLRTLMMFDAVLIVSVLGFVSTVAVAQFVARRGTAS